MATLTGIISNLNGSIGDLTFKKNGGQIVVSQKVTQTNDAKTDPQYKQRMKWANVIQMYKVLQPYMKLAFGGSANGRNDYNKFVSANVIDGDPVYLTKGEVTSGACIVAPYQITHGTLKSISVTGKGKAAVTNISLGSLALSTDTTVAQFSNAVVQNNKNFDYGDQITYFLVTQEMNDVTNIPVADVDACCVVLDKTNEAKLWALIDKRGFSAQDGYLAAQSDADFGNHGMVWILSRKSNSKTLISAQYLICENAMLATYQDSDAYDAAVESYGGVKEVYLTPSGILNVASETENTEDSEDTDDDSSSDDSSSSQQSGGSSTQDSGSDSEGEDTTDTTVKKTISATANPAEGGTFSGTGEYAVGSSAVVTAIANAGYSFKDWSDGETNNVRIITVSDDVELTANFEAE